MALLSHYSKRNMSYRWALEYLLLRHDDHARMTLPGDDGLPQMREDFAVDGILCEPFSFAQACEELNRKVRKNRTGKEVNAHHFILSFEPEDGERGLTREKAQAIAVEFTRRCLPGFQAVVVTHMDGTRREGKIHTHIIINSVRLDDEGEHYLLPRAGGKLQASKNLLRHLEFALDELCAREGLAPRRPPSPDRITDGEYWAAVRGQERLDRRNRQIIADGGIPSEQEFKTDTQKLRELIHTVSAGAGNVGEFRRRMEEGGSGVVTDGEHWKYLRLDGEGTLPAGYLGSAYKEEEVKKRFSLPPVEEKARKETFREEPEIRRAAPSRTDRDER